jgi:hypothetical protein
MKPLKTSILVVAVGVAFSLFAMIITWLVLGDASPFRGYFLLVLLSPSPEVEAFVGTQAATLGCSNQIICQNIPAWRLTYHG